MLVISDEEVERLLNPTDLQGPLSRALISFSTGRVTQPVRQAIQVADYDGWFGLMPAVYEGVIGTKLVTVFPGNAKRGLHTHDAVIHLFRAETGEPLACMGGRIITALRTAAVSALATRELSDPHARVLAILGSGVQARSHYDALRLVRDIDETRVWSRTPEHARVFAEEIGARTMTAEETVRGADVVVTATSSLTPVLMGEWLKEGAYVNAVGAVGPLAREMDDRVMMRAAVIVESRGAAVQEAKEITQSGVAVYAELGEILAGTKPKPNSAITVYKSLGMAVEDVAIAKLVYEKWAAEIRSEAS